MKIGKFINHAAFVLLVTASYGYAAELKEHEAQKVGHEELSTACNDPWCGR